MFLNYSTSKNEVIGRTSNSTLIMLYGHVKERYAERFQRIQEVTGIKELDFNYLMNKTVEIVNEYYYECKSRNFRKVRHVIRSEVKLTTGKKNFIADLSILLAGSEVTFSDKHPYVIENQYKELVANNELAVHDTILAVETINVTIRLEDETATNFTYQPDIAKIKMPTDNFKITDEDLVYITEHMLDDEDTKISPWVQIYLKTIKHRRNKRR
jgi:hypothetical protein